MRSKGGAAADVPEGAVVRVLGLLEHGLGVHPNPAPAPEQSSSTAQISDRAEVSPGKRPITFVRRRTSTNVLSRRFVVRIRLRCSKGKRR